MLCHNEVLIIHCVIGHCCCIANFVFYEPPLKVHARKICTLYPQKIELQFFTKLGQTRLTTRYRTLSHNLLSTQRVGANVYHIYSQQITFKVIGD